MGRGKWICCSLGVVCLVVGLVVWQTTGQDRDFRIEAVPGPIKPSAPEASLPIRQVILFSSGVGYLQREGDVEGDARVDLSFPAADINDLLKSLILQDLNGGRVSSVNYDSHDPIDKILHSFAVDLNNNPTLGQILNQARGEKIELIRQANSNETSVRQVGVIVGMEAKPRLGKDVAIPVEHLNLSCDNGLTSIPMEHIKSVRFLNPVLENEFQRALRVLAASHDTKKKTVSLGFSGQGKRSVRVGYVIEHPIWKTTYRLRVEPNGKIFMQGWAIVENTSDDDWNDVRMVLVSGRPISYKMNMYEPLYIPRPEVEPELFGSLRPPVYGGAMNAEPQAVAAAPPGYTVPMNGFGKQMPFQGSGQEFKVEQLPGNNPAPNSQWPTRPITFGSGNLTNGIPSQSVPSIPFTPAVDFDSTTVPRPNQPDQIGGKLSYNELQRRREIQAQQQAKAKRDGSAIAGLNFKEGIASVASADEAGDFYQYTLDHKITLPRQKSAMLPILDQIIEGTKVSIYNEATHAKYPLLGLKLKNSSKLHLSQGPITVYEDGSYAGDTRILDVQPNEERLLSYALDQAVEVKSEVKMTPSPDMSFKIGEANLTANYNMRRTRTYVIKNRASKDRTVILEHPVDGAQSKWKLIEPQKPLETTRDHYRFQVMVPAGKSVSFAVVEEQARVDQTAWPLAQPQYLHETGVQIKAQTVLTHDKLLSVKIDKGLVLPTLTRRISKTYFVQNNSDIDRSFTVDHLISAGWVRLDEKSEPHKGPAAYRFVLPVQKGKTAMREIVEEQTRQEKGIPMRSLPESTIHEYLASPVPSADVKAVFTKFLAMNAKIAEAQKQLQEQGEQLRQVSDDQARLRENLKLIPQSSEPYKQFLEKFVTQEGEIEGLQKRLRQLQTALQQQQREMDAAFVRPSEVMPASFPPPPPPVPGLTTPPPY